MNRLNDTLYYYAEVTVEASSPLVLASGKSGNFFDVELVRDANGLPAVPGTTIAGILRHAVQKTQGEAVTKQLFGFIDKNNGGSSSALETSWAYVHDSNNRYHKSFCSKDSIEKDPVLSELYITDNPDFKRDHVRLSEKGTACDAGKFDRYFVPSGTRFTFSLGLWTSGESDMWDGILNALFSPTFRIGAAGRDGYGKIKVVEIKVPSKGYFDLSKEEDVRSFRVCDKSYDLSKIKVDADKIELNLAFPLGFRIGGGSKSFLPKNNHPADMLPYSERIISWNGDKGSFGKGMKIVLPASSVKGSLRHRAAFHLARINKDWNRAVDGEDDGLSELFGCASNERNPDAKGMAGKLWFTDLYLDQARTYQLSRNSIDRFTGGTLNGALFQEENVCTEQLFKLDMYLDKDVDKESPAYKAFSWAVDDLRSGRLALGGGSGHGLGFNHAEVK